MRFISHKIKIFLDMRVFVLSLIPINENPEIMKILQKGHNNKMWECWNAVQITSNSNSFSHIPNHVASICFHGNLHGNKCKEGRKKVSYTLNCTLWWNTKSYLNLNINLLSNFFLSAEYNALLMPIVVLETNIALWFFGRI